MSASNYVHLSDCEVLTVTNGAILIEYEGEEIWLPKSQVSESEQYETGDCCTISISRWLAEERGLEGDD